MFPYSFRGGGRDSSVTSKSVVLPFFPCNIAQTFNKCLSCLSLNFRGSKPLCGK